MATEAGTAYVGLEFKRGDLAQLEAQTNQAGGKFSSSWASFAKRAVVGMVAAFGVIKAIDFVSGAVRQASDLNESITKVQRVFGDAAGGVLEFSKTTSTALGQSRNESLAAAGTFGNLFRALKLGQGESATMSTRLVTLAGDLASFNNVDPATALDALRSGLVGETEPLRRFGVNMNDATLRAEALKLGLIDAGDSGAGALDPAIKAQAAYALILDQTKLAQGDFARTSDGLANQQRILSAQWADLQTQLGALLLPVIVKVVAAFNGAIPILKSAGGAIQSVVGAIAESSVGQAVGQAFGDIADGARAAVEFVGGLVQIFQDARKAGDDLGAALQITAINALHQLGIDTDKAVQIVGAVTGALGKARDIWNRYGTAVLSAAGPLLEAATSLDNVKAAIKAVAGFISDNREIFIALGAAIGVAVAALTAMVIVEEAWAAATAIAATAQALLNVAMAAFPVVAVAIAVIALVAAIIYLYRNNETARQIIQAAWQAISGVVLNAVNTIITVIRTLVTVGTALWQRFGGAITTIAKAGFQTVVGVIRGVMKVVQGVINVALGLITGDWSRAWNGVKQIVSGALGIVRALLVGAARIWLAAARALGEAILDGVKAGISGLAKFVLGKIQAIPAALGDLTQLLYHAGQQIIDGLIDGITSKIGAVGDAVGGVVSSITDHFPNSPQAKTGPLARHTPEIMGARIATQLAAGINQGAPAVAGAASGLAGLVAGGAGALPRMPTGGAIEGGGVVSAGAAGSLRPEVRVFIGDRELTDMVRVEVNGQLVDEKHAIQAGTRW